MADHNDYGDNNWRLPTIRELNVLFGAQAAISDFHDQTYGASGVAQWHWARAAWSQSFESGNKMRAHPEQRLSFRSVCD